MKSFKLSDEWDLVMTRGGSLALVDGKERVAQDVACYERTFLGEEWFDQSQGVPYLDRELAELPPEELVIARANQRALAVPNVLTARTELTEFRHRVLKGDIYVTTDDGETLHVTV